MPRTRMPAVAVLAALVATACSDSPAGPGQQAGSVIVNVTTTGLSVDADGYSASAGGQQQAVGTNASVTLSGVAAGSVSVSLGGIAANCSVLEANPQTVTVVANQSVNVTFTVTCARIGEAMTLLAADREGTIYTVDEATGAATTLFVPVTDDGGGSLVAMGVISSMSWVWETDDWWLGLGGNSVCFGCLYTLDATSGVSGFLSDPSALIRAVAGLAVHPETGKVYTTEADGSGFLYELDQATGAPTEIHNGLADPSSGKGLAFSSGGLLYIGGSDEIATLDVATGGLTDLGVPALNGFPGTVTGSRLRSMATREGDGTIFAITRNSRNDPAELATVDEATGDLTWVGTAPYLLDGLAYVPTRLVDLVAPPIASRLTFVSDRTGNYEVYVMDPRGGNLVQVTDDPGGDEDPTILPDRSAVTFASDRDGNWELYTKNADGTGTPTRLTNTSDAEFDAVYSPDGSKILFTRRYLGANNLDLYTMDAAGGNELQITNTAEWDANPGWSPDGQQITFTSRITGDWEVYVTDATTLGTPTQLTGLLPNEGVNFDPDWSPDGSKIVFISNRTGQFEVWVMDANGANPTQLTTDGGNEPDWSSDGTQIIFARGRDGGRTGDYEIYIMNADGSGVRPISNSRGNDEEIDWR